MSEKETIKMIESQCKESIIRKLRSAGLGGKYKEGDYSKAKKLIFMGRWIDSDIYDEQISWIVEYLKI